MNVQRTGWPRRFIRWLFGAPFQTLPPQFGNTVPLDLQKFEADAEDARRCGTGHAAAALPVRHGKTRPARQDSSLERQ